MLLLFLCMTGMSCFEGENFKGHPSQMNPIATRKFHIVRCGERRVIEKPCPYRQESDIKAHTVV